MIIIPTWVIKYAIVSRFQYNDTTGIPPYYERSLPLPRPTYRPLQLHGFETVSIPRHTVGSIATCFRNRFYTEAYSGEHCSIPIPRFWSISILLIGCIRGTTIVFLYHTSVSVPGAVRCIVGKNSDYKLSPRLFAAQVASHHNPGRPKPLGCTCKNKKSDQNSKHSRERCPIQIPPVSCVLGLGLGTLSLFLS